MDFAKVQAVVEGVLHLLEGHAVQLFAGVFGEDVAVLAALVAVVGDVPLEGKIGFHGRSSFLIYENRLTGSVQVFPVLPGNGSGNYLSPAPQALPQAEGFSSFFSSSAPQEPLAPQAEATFSSFHSARFFSAISCTSVRLFRAFFVLCFIIRIYLWPASTHFFVGYLQKSNPSP